MLFEIRKDQKTHYLLGTMHLGTTDAYTFVPLVKDVLATVTCYAAETNLDEMSDHQYISHYYLPDNKTIRAYISDRHYMRYKRIISKAYDVDLDRLNTLLPIVLTNQLITIKMAMDQRPPLDHYLWSVAGLRGIYLTGVETIEDQIDTLLNISLDVQIQAFRKMMKQVSKVNQHFTKLSEYYAAGNYQMLYRLSKRELGILRKPLLYDRNEKMLSSIGELFDEHASVLIAVGAGHIGGDKGLRAGLKRDGYRVTLMV